MPLDIEAQLAEAEVTVEFEDAREEALIRQAVLGKDADDFLHSPVGRFVVGAALQDQAFIEEQLTKVSVLTPFGKRKILKLQQKHEAVGLAISWLTDAIRLGHMAERALEQPTE
jgi:hypothetical protein